MTDEQRQLDEIRKEMATWPKDAQKRVLALADKIREAIAKDSLVLSAFSLVAAEMLVLNPEDE
jgi:hypothetical protein